MGIQLIGDGTALSFYNDFFGAHALSSNLACNRLLLHSWVGVGVEYHNLVHRMSTSNIERNELTGHIIEGMQVRSSSPSPSPSSLLPSPPPLPSSPLRR